MSEREDAVNAIEGPCAGLGHQLRMLPAELARSGLVVGLCLRCDGWVGIPLDDVRDPGRTRRT